MVGFEAVRTRLAACAGERHGIAQVTANIAHNGRVIYARIDGDFQGTAEGSCMATAMRTAQFPQFENPTLRVEYPLAF